MNIKDYQTLTDLQPSDIFLFNGANGTKTITWDALMACLITSPHLFENLTVKTEVANKVDSVLIGNETSGNGKMTFVDFLNTLNEKMAKNRIDFAKLPETDAVADEDYLMIGLQSGTVKKMSYSDFESKIHSDLPWGRDMPLGMRRNIFRGKYLGSEVTEAQWEAIRSGSFDDMYIGDYWQEVGGRIWRIADFDYWWGVGDNNETIPNVNQHHVVILPDDVLYRSSLVEGGATSFNGGYANIVPRKNNFAPGKAIVDAFFGASHILRKREILVGDTFIDGELAGGTLQSFYDSDLELPTEQMYYGSLVSSISGKVKGSSGIPYMMTNSPQQLALLALCPGYKGVTSNETGVILQNMASNTDISSYNSVQKKGSWSSYTLQGGIRPVFGIVG